MQKIMFDDKYELTKVVLNRTKTMTRRNESFCGFIPDAINTGFNRFQILDNGIVRCHNDKSNTWIEYKTRYKIGEVVAVAQSYNSIYDYLGEEYGHDGRMCIMVNQGCRNKMFVSPIYMPHQVKIIGIKIEHLQDISDEDCRLEGILKDDAYDDYNGYYDDTPWYYYGDEDDDTCFDTPQEAYASLINAISRKGTWERNPWVVCYSFELIK